MTLISGYIGLFIRGEKSGGKCSGGMSGYHIIHVHGRRLGAEFGGRKKISRRTKFSNDLLLRKMFHFDVDKFLMSFFSRLLLVSTVNMVLCNQGLNCPI